MPAERNGFKSTVYTILGTIFVAGASAFMGVQLSVAVLADDMAEVSNQVKKNTELIRAIQRDFSSHCAVGSASDAREVQDIKTVTKRLDKHIEHHPDRALDKRLTVVELKVEGLE